MVMMDFLLHEVMDDQPQQCSTNLLLDRPYSRQRQYQMGLHCRNLIPPYPLVNLKPYRSISVKKFCSASGPTPAQVFRPRYRPQTSPRPGDAHGGVTHDPGRTCPIVVEFVFSS